MFLKSATVVISLVVAVSCLGTAESLSCYSCSGSDCLNSATIGQLTECSAVTVNCYTQFNGYVPIRRGCWPTQFSEQLALCPGNNCELCAENYCNLKSTAAHKCTVCSSVVDERCVSDPESLTAVQCEAVTLDVTDNHCYSRVIGSVTERGCVQSQSDLDACDGSLCETCSGDNCNIDEFPSERQKCVKCSGAECSAATEASYCDDPFESCVSVRRSDGTIAKNCESSLAESDRTFCQSDPASCSRCSNNECNKGEIDFSASHRCYTCQGTDCLKSSVEIETCPNVDDICVTLFDEFNPVRRGCKSALSRQEKDICDDPDNVNCDPCSSDSCNLNSREDHQCYYCSSVTDSQCIAAPLSVMRCPAPTTEVSAEAQCYTRVIGMITERGCLGTPATDAECKSSENCQMCAIEDGEACNKGLFPPERIKCVVGTVSNQYCPDPRDSCVQIMQGTTRTKKCRSSMSATEVAFCQANSNKCDFCTGDNCNQQDRTFNYVDCVSCSSSTDKRCTGEASGITSMEHCSTCAVVYTASSGTVRRGCLTSLSAQEQQQCSTELGCSTCTTNRCNLAVYPADRLSCYSCLEGSCFSHDSIKLEYCPTYQQGDTCIVQTDSSGKLIRMGCKSSLNTDQATSCNANTQLCRTCTGAGCNKPSSILPSASCVQCTSAHDPDCIAKASKFDAEPCSDPANTQCYTRLLPGMVTERGCASDLNSTAKTQCASGTDCNLCSSPDGKCNSVEPSWSLSCYTCFEGSCFSHDSIELKHCSATTQQGESCIVQMDSEGKLVRMGCKSALSSSQAATCTANSELCKTCTETRCNKPAQFLPAASCVQCSSAHDPNCAGRVSKLDAEPCNDPLNTQCFTLLLPGMIVERGCASDLEPSTKAQCVQGTDCNLCSSPDGKCNSEQPVWKNRLSCHTCMEGSCFSHDSIKLQHCSSTEQSESCFVQLDSSGKLLLMGCKSTLSSSQAATCNANSQLCPTCSETGCNQPSKYLPSASCVQCSSAHDPDCIGKASKFDAEPCNDPANSQCYSRLLSSAVTERGCVSDLDSQANALCVRGTDCSLCSSTSGTCNSLEYPTGWRRCFQCDSAVDATCKNAQSGVAPYCATYSSDSQCSTIVQQDGRTVRKCAAAGSQECTGSAKCHSCTTNGCNNRASTDPIITTSTEQPTTTPAPAGRPIVADLLIAALLSITIVLSIRRNPLVC